MKKGEPPSMVDADVANPVIDACAAFTSMTIIPQGRGTLKVAGRTAVLDLTGTASGTPDGSITVILCKNFVPTYYTLVGTEGDPV